MSASTPTRARMHPLKRWAAPAGGMVLAILLTATSGCAPRPQNPDEPTAVEYTVQRFDDQRQGFEINEQSDDAGEIRDDFDRAVEFLANDRYPEAIALLEQVTARSPRHAVPHIDLALAYEHQEQPEKAEEQLKMALELIPGHPVASNIYGLLLRKSGRFTEAREVFETSLRRFPEFMATRKNLGILCELYLGDLEAAVEHYEIYSEATPGDEEVTVWIAGLRQRLDAGN